MCAVSSSDVCQFVSVEHFFLWHEIQDGRQKIWFFIKSIETVAFKPHICTEHEYKLGYCGHFSVSTITLSGIVAEIRSFHCFHDNYIHVRSKDNSNNHSEQKMPNPELPRVGFGAHLWYHCRISPPRFLAECRKKRLNQGSLVFLYFNLSALFDLYLVFACLFSCTALFVSISQVIVCEDHLRNNLYCVGWGIKLCSTSTST